MHQSEPIPRLSGREDELSKLMQGNRCIEPKDSDFDLNHVRSCFACALHMHQPTIPAGREGDLISHLQYMFEHSGEGDNHNAEPFAQCYRRFADLLPDLIGSGCNPRIMLDYSGNLLWGVHQMGRDDIIEALRYLACDPGMQGHVEWLGTFWSHAVAPSTPIPDLKLQITAWQHQFADYFGVSALQRVKGFSLPEMHLPNHPETLYALIKALKECGYQWIMVQEDSVERMDGSALSHDQKYVPNRLIARNSDGESVSLVALIKTQGSDTKLVGQMQPCYEAMSMDRLDVMKKTIPSIVTQIADGENGGVMMNEFPSAYLQANHKLKDESDKVRAVNGSEYLEKLLQAGFSELDYPPIQAIGQHRIWQALEHADSANFVLTDVIGRLKEDDPNFTMQGASWTNNLSWVEGYENVLEPMGELSARFHAVYDPKVKADPMVTQSSAYQDALLYVLLSQTSCFRYWGHGVWTDYAKEIYRRGMESLS